MNRRYWKSQRRKHEFCLCVQQVIFDLEQVLSLYGFTDYYRERAHAEIVGRNMDLLKPIPVPILSEEREYTRVVDSFGQGLKYKQKAIGGFTYGKRSNQQIRTGR